MRQGAPVRASAVVSWRAGGEPELVEIELAPPRGEEILVDIEAVGVCHADVAANAGDFPVSFPVVLGHEGVGVVRDTGPEVRGLVAGDRVVLSYDSCGICKSCRAGRPTQCDHYMERNFPSGDRAWSGLRAAGSAIHGGFFGQSSFATVARAHERNAVRVDTSLPASVLAPLGCGVQTGVGAVLNVARPWPGDSVVVVGLGAVGLSAVMATLASGVSSVVAVDVDEDRLELARELGVRVAINAGHGDWASTVRDVLGAGVDIAIECSGSPDAFGSVIECLRAGGTAVVAGAPAFGATSPLDIAAVVNKSLSIHGTVEGNSRSAEMVPFLVGVIESGRLPIDRLVTEFAFAEVRAALDGMGRGSQIKPVLVMPVPQRSLTTSTTTRDRRD
jgi:aryl-alcohol dehydrogenase